MSQTSIEFSTTAPGESSADVPVRISNDGATPTAALVTALAGQDPGAFVVTSDACGGAVLAPATTCEIHLSFRPSDERQFAGELRLSGGAAAASIALSGRADAGVHLSLAGSFSFSGVKVGQSATTVATVSNTGPHASAPLAFDASGDTSSFTVGGDCIGRALPSGGSCGLEVTFSPQDVGPKTLSVNASGSRSSSARAMFDGYGTRLVTLTIWSSGTGSVDVFGSPDSCTGQPCRVGFEIGGPPQKATLAAKPGTKALFDHWEGDCSGTSLSCELPIDGERSVHAFFVAAVSVAFDATSVAAGSGTIGLEPGTTCAAPCRAIALVPRGSRVRLSAVPDSESQMRWMSGCSQMELGCELTAGDDISATAVFNGANYVFVSSGTYPTNLGVAAYDQACNESAHAAGLPGPYVAWLSTSTASASDRVASARGFIRVDGRPFADTLGPGAPVYFPPALDEMGAIPAAYPMAMTGTDKLGQLVAGYNCSDWTDSGSQGLQLGDPFGGAGAWIASSGSSCQGSWLIYCIGTGIRRPLQRDNWLVGRVAFTSSGALRSGGGIAAADSLCAAEARAAGLTGSFKALLATDGASAASRFNPKGAPWVRRDGVPIVERASDLGRGKLIAPIDMSASGAYDFGGAWAWAGAFTTADVGTAESTCASWTSTAANLSGRWGEPTSISPYMGFGAFALSCDFGPFRVYCLEE